VRRKPSLAGQFLLLQLGIVLLVVVAVAGVSLAESDAAFRDVEGRRLLSVAETVAANPVVRLRLTDPLGQLALSGIAETARGTSGASYVLVAGADGQLLTGPDIGRPAVLGDSQVRSGRSWVGVVDDAGTAALVAHAPVLDDYQGKLVGFVVVGRTYQTVVQRLASATPNLLTYLVLGGALGIVGSLLLARRFKRQTLGLEPREITGLVEHREAMLHGIKEGVVGVDLADRVTLVNDEAIRLLSLPAAVVGMSLHALGLPRRLLDVLGGGISGVDQVVLRDDRVLVLNRMPVVVRGRQAGSVTTLRDRTELTALERELDVSRHATEALRAQAHEFSNRLHTIAGLIELQEYEEVVRYVMRASQAHEKLTRDVTTRIADPALAALLIAKATLAAEQRAELRVSSSSSLPAIDEDLAVDLVTVVGNLVDNALESVGAGGWVEVEISTSASEVLVTVRDSGTGVPPELVDEIFRQGYTTKAPAGTHRGFGLALTRLICTRHGGSIAVDGAVFTARIPRAVEVPA